MAKSINISASVMPAAGTGGSGTPPSGSIMFKEGTTLLAGPLNVSGGTSAGFSISTLSVGEHSIVAEYSGDANYTSSSATLDQVVNKAPTTTIVMSGVNPSMLGQGVTFTAQVLSAVPIFPGNQPMLPAGTVIFKEGAVVLAGPVALNSGGQATFSTSALNVGNHTITAEYSGSDNFHASSGSVVQTVNDVDRSLSILDVKVIEGNSGTTEAIFTVILSHANGASAVTVNFSTTDGTATAGSDYTAQTGALTFAPGEIAKSIHIAVWGDATAEANETFFVQLAQPNHASIAKGQAIATIINDDGGSGGTGALPALSINDVRVREGNAGTTADVIFTVALSEVSGQPVTVEFATVDGTATGASTGSGDYASMPANSPGTLTFNPGDLLETITITVNGDDFNELDETFFVQLTNPSDNAMIANGLEVGTATILNDDAPPSISITDSTVNEGAGAGFTLTLSAASAQTITVNFLTTDGTAVAASGDYITQSGAVTFVPGDTSKSISVQTVDDSIKENTETFLVNLLNPVNATIADAQGVGTIADDNDAAPAIAINNATVLEGNSGQVNAVFIVNLSAASAQTVTVDFATADATATGAASGGDYVTQSGALTFMPGETTKSIVAVVNGDTDVEESETFFVNLSGANNAVIPAGTQGTGIILNDDAAGADASAPTISIADVSVGEPDSGSVHALFTVSLSHPSADAITLNFAAADGTATAGSDYTMVAETTLTFMPGETSKTISVTVWGDVLSEQNETFLVNLSDASANAVLAAGTKGTGTIIDNDGLPQLSIDDVTVTEGNSGTVNASFTVSLSTPSPQTVMVDFATVDGTAQASSDYVAGSGVVTFDPGDVIKTIVIRVNGDVLNEADEVFFIHLGNPVNAGMVRELGVGSISNDDLPTIFLPIISMDNIAVTEGDAASTTATFDVRLTPASQQTVSVNFLTTDGTARAGSDYLAQAGKVTFEPGETGKTISVQVLGDIFKENDETFFVNLVNPVNATVGKVWGVVRIMDDDALPSISISSPSVVEGNDGSSPAVFTVSLSAAAADTVTVDFSTEDGTAKMGTDYTSSSGRLVFAPGSTMQAITVVVNGDLINESDETFTVRLSNPLNATPDGATGTGTITDNDGVPSIMISNAMMSEPDTGAANVMFRVSLSNPSQSTVTVDFATEDDTALAGSDYTAATGTLTFAPGEMMKSVMVALIGDVLTEQNETFSVRLSNNSTGSVLTEGTHGTATILDNDGPPQLSIDDVMVTESSSGMMTDADFTVSRRRAARR